MALYRLLIILASCWFIVQARQVAVVAPNTIRLDTEETVAIVSESGVGGNNEKLEIYLQDFPARARKFSEQEVLIADGDLKIVKIHVTAENLPDVDIINTNVYVLLVVKGPSVNKEVKLLVTHQSGYVFVQTDKPIYNPQQQVKIRIIPLNEELLPKDGDVRLQIRNPQDVVVQEKLFSNPWPVHSRQFPTHVFQFPPHTLHGEWSVVIHYGHQFQLNSSVTFVVEEYVLPMFTVKLETPNFILPNEEKINIELKADYVYGRKVTGTAIFKFSVKNEVGHIVDVGITSTKEVQDGESDFQISVDSILKHPQINGFPHGNRLVVEATVVDVATGNKEKATDEHCVFSKSPYVITFKESLKDFKPGYASSVVADVAYVNGKPAAKVPTYIKITDSTGKEIEVQKPRFESDRYGRVVYYISTPSGYDQLFVAVGTDDKKYLPDQQFVGNFVLTKYQSTGGYIVISRTDKTKSLEIGSKFTATVFVNPVDKITNLFYMVISRGKIVQLDNLHLEKLFEHQLEFRITADMAPSVRVVVCGIYINELVADSLRLEVETECKEKAKVKIDTEFKEKTPGSNGKFILDGHPNTIVGVLAVDSAVYALRNQGKLTKEKMFRIMGGHDLGCGPGGGRSTEAILANAGVVVLGNFNSPNQERKVLGCAERLRKKREAIAKTVDDLGSSDLKKCCKYGAKEDKYGRTCEERAEIVRNFVTDDDGICADIFLKCCNLTLLNISISQLEDGKFDINDGGRAVGEFIEDLEHVSEEEEEELEKTLVRKDFRETWLFQDYIIGAKGKHEVITNLPHSITTWIVQAVSVSRDWGMCVSEPQEIISFKNIFIHLNIPYSVVRNEQVEIQATIFNYNPNRVPVTVYMYGVADLCTGVQEGEKSERKKIWVEAHSTESVGFPVVPLKIHEYSIRVVALSPIGVDVIDKKLRVVAEGAEETEDISIILDPSNQQNRPQRDVVTPTVTDSIDDSQSLQVTSIKLRPSKDYVPGTESCIISAIGDEFGPTVETVLHNPETLIRKPIGCGEQTMMFLGPTIYTLHFLKVKSEVSPEIEKTIFGLVREGYDRELTFRKPDGSYGAWIHHPSSTWLTAFVMKMFCQASKYVFIDKEVICSGVRWLINNQKVDGSFEDAHPVIHRDMMGGNGGTIPMTAFVLIALNECTCDLEQLKLARLGAVLYLETKIPVINDPYTMALVSYALALSGSELKITANQKLRKMSHFDEGLNQRYWKTGSASHGIETTAYALLTQVKLQDLTYSVSIINWLNNQRLVGGSFPSTQDTVVGLQALSEYSVLAQSPDINLVCNVTYSNDRKLAKSIAFHKENALVLQQFELEKVGGTLFFKTAGKGVGLLSVKMKYNVPVVEKLCKFETTVNVTEVKIKPKPKPIVPPDEDLFDSQELRKELDIDKSQEIGGEAGKEPEFYDYNEINLPDAVRRGKRQEPDYYDKDYEDGEDKNKDKKNDDDDVVVDDDDDDRARIGDANNKNSKPMLQINICTKYLSDKESDMAIIDAGIFSGFKPVENDLKLLVKDENIPIDRYEIGGRGVIFYLRYIPHNKQICLSFRITKEYIVGNVQPSVITVYDYYNTEDSCTIFYRPDSNSPLLKTICEKSVCQCAEGGCPSKTPFSEVLKKPNPGTRRQHLLHVACEKTDYVWKGKVTSWKKKDGFIRINFLVLKVLKSGIEPTAETEGLSKSLLMRDTCNTFESELVRNQEYIIMGKDGDRFEDRNTRILSYRYLADRTTSFYKLTTLKEAENKQLHKLMQWLEKKLQTEGCQT